MWERSNNLWGVSALSWKEGSLRIPPSLSLEGLKLPITLGAELCLGVGASWFLEAKRRVFRTSPTLHIFPSPLALQPSCSGLSQAQGAPGRQGSGSLREQMGMWLPPGHPKGLALFGIPKEERLLRSQVQDWKAVSPAWSD